MTYHFAWENPIDTRAARALAADLCVYACNGSRGRPERGDPIYDSITEHRDFGSGYSSCADLAHWLAFRLGIRAPFINRKEYKGWKTGVNLTRVAWCEFSREASSKDRYQPGDILVVWQRPDTQDAHVTIVLRDGRLDEHNPVDEIETANYGAPGGKISTSSVLYASDGKAILGSRKIRRVISLSDMMIAAQRSGRLEMAEDVTRGPDGSLLWRP